MGIARAAKVTSVLAVASLGLWCSDYDGEIASGPSGADANPARDDQDDPRNGDAPDAAGTDADLADAAVDPACLADVDPARLLFIGNSFTLTDDLPGVFRKLALAGGYAPTTVDMRAIGGQTLEGHRNDESAEGAVARIDEGWDVVVLQEYSTRPTDAVGPAERFEDDAVWFHDRVVARNPAARVLLYETFARHPNHSLYPGTFDDPADMQAQLSFWYHRVAEQTIPARAEQPVRVEVAHVGDAWQRALEVDASKRLHGADDYHPSPAGAYLSALVFFGTVYGRSTTALPAVGVTRETADHLQAIADAITGHSVPAPAIACPSALGVGDSLRLDFGPLPAAGWATVAGVSAAAGPLVSVAGEPTQAFVTVAGFNGVQEGGAADNTLGYPGDVSRDSLWVGSFDGHQAARENRAEVELTGLGDGLFGLTLFASRDGRDEGDIGRLTRYTLGTESRDLEASNNRSEVASFTARSTKGTLRFNVEVSPAGGARFAYLGSLVLERLE